MPYRSDIDVDVLTLTEQSPGKFAFGAGLVVLTPLVAFAAYYLSPYTLIVTIPAALFTTCGGVMLAGMRENVRVCKSTQQVVREKRIFNRRMERWEGHWENADAIRIKHETSGGAFGQPLTIRYRVLIGDRDVYVTEQEDDALAVSSHLASFLGVSLSDKAR